MNIILDERKEVYFQSHIWTIASALSQSLEVVAPGQHKEAHLEENGEVKVQHAEEKHDLLLGLDPCQVSHSLLWVKHDRELNLSQSGGKELNEQLKEGEVLADEGIFIDVLVLAALFRLLGVRVYLHLLVREVEDEGA